MAILSPGSRHFVFWRRALSCLRSLQDEEWRDILTIALTHTQRALVKWFRVRSAEVKQSLAGLSPRWHPCTFSALSMDPASSQCQPLLCYANQAAL